jgi:hypothetical protein
MFNNFLSYAQLRIYILLKSYNSKAIILVIFKLYNLSLCTEVISFSKII